MNKKLPKVKYGEVFDIDDFLDAVDNGDIDEDDGYGKYHDGENLTDKHFDFYSNPEDYPYVVWYNVADLDDDELDYKIHNRKGFDNIWN